MLILLSKRFINNTASFISTTTIKADLNIVRDAYKSMKEHKREDKDIIWTYACPSCAVYYGIKALIKAIKRKYN